VLCAFGAANDRLETWLTLGDVAAWLHTVGHHAPVVEEDLLSVLGQLKDWQLIERTQAHGAHYSTAEDFERNNRLVDDRLADTEEHRLDPRHPAS